MYVSVINIEAINILKRTITEIILSTLSPMDLKDRSARTVNDML